MSRPLTYSIEETTRLLGVSRSTVCRLIRDKRIIAHKLGARLVRIDAESLGNMIAGLPRVEYRKRSA
jgi:excisionase family DNA binding protein